MYGAWSSSASLCADLLRISVDCRVAGFVLIYACTAHALLSSILVYACWSVRFILFMFLYGARVLLIYVCMAHYFILVSHVWSAPVFLFIFLFTDVFALGVAFTAAVR